jgi:hypothetical protein
MTAADPNSGTRAEDRAAARMRMSHGVELICGVRNMPKFAKLTEQSN